jgi:hypothetical protein
LVNDFQIKDGTITVGRETSCVHCRDVDRPVDTVLW